MSFSIESLPNSQGYEITVKSSRKGDFAEIQLKKDGEVQSYHISVAHNDKLLSMGHEDWKIIAETAIEILGKNQTVSLFSMEKAEIYPYEKKLNFTKKGEAIANSVKIQNSDPLRDLTTILDNTIRKVEDAAETVFRTQVATQSFRAAAPLPFTASLPAVPSQHSSQLPSSHPNPSESSRPPDVSTRKTASPNAGTTPSPAISSAPLPRITDAAASALSSLSQSARSSLQSVVPAFQAVSVPHIQGPTVTATDPKRSADKTQYLVGKMSQHHDDYKTDKYVLGLDPRNKEKRYFSIGACTALAISFAATAPNATIATENTADEHLKSYLTGERLVKGIEAYKELKDKPKGGVSLEAVNLNIEDGLMVYNAMSGKPPIAIQPIYAGIGDTWFPPNAMDSVTKKNWHEDILKGIKPGQGAVVTFGTYSIGIRRIGDAFEIFDSHRTNTYTSGTGACVSHCPNATEFLKTLKEIREKTSPFGYGDNPDQGADGVDIMIF